MNIYLIVIITLLIIQWVLSALTELLNLKHFSLTVPAEFREIYDEQRYELSQRYSRDKTLLNLILSTLMLLLTLAFILRGGFSLVTEIARSLSGYMIVQGLIFAGILTLLTTLISIPFKLYDTFVIERKYGFNRTTVKTFVLDQIKGLLITAILGIPIFSLILFFFSRLSLAWLWTWLALSAIQLFIAFLAPLVILPLFNKFTPLEEGELRQEIEDYTEKQNYTVQGVYKIDGSRRSSKGNAYFTGFGRTKRIALFDTLLDKFQVDELLSILAHEVGHCKLGHIKKKILHSLASSLLMFFLLSFFIGQPGLYQAFQVEGTPLYAGFVFFFFIYSPLSMLLGLIDKAISRKHEYQADEFSAKTAQNPQAMIRALKKLSVDSLSNLTPHPLKVFLEYTHPPVLKRIEALEKSKY
jgi:STE24 endopeptidase